MKKCIDCLETKPLSDFYKNGKPNGLYHSYCKKCYNKRTNARRYTTPEKRRKSLISNKKYLIKMKNKQITRKQLSEMLEAIFMAGVMRSEKSRLYAQTLMKNVLEAVNKGK